MDLGIRALGIAAGSIIALTIASQGVMDPMLHQVQDLQFHAQAVTNETLNRLTDRMVLVDAVGLIQSSDGSAIDALDLTLRASASGGDLDVSRLSLKIGTPQGEVWAAWGLEGGPGIFTLRGVRDADRSISADPPLLGSEDLGSLLVDLRADANNLPLGPNTPLDVQIVPGTGRSLELHLHTPPTFGNARVLSLK